MEIDGGDDTSGLDLAASCPECGARSTLDDQASALAESTCARCAGSLLSAHAAERLMVELLQAPPGRFGQLARQGARGTISCPACGASTTSVALRGAIATVCARCGSTWFPNGALFELSGGRFGKRATRSSAEPARTPVAARPSPATTPPAAARATSAARSSLAPTARPVGTPRRPQSSSSSSKLMIAAGVVGVIIIGSALAYLGLGHTPKPAEVAVDAGPATPAVDPIADFTFSGRDVAWWSNRLTTLRARGDDEGQRLYQLTRRRAEANGLTITEDGPRVTALPSRALLTRIAERGGSR